MLTWLKNFNYRMKGEERNVVLFLDIVTYHPNITSHSQSMNQKITHQNLKVIYRDTF